MLERNLLRFFRNATDWDAIVLLDEADIYLERRSSNDLRRNNVVSSKALPHKVNQILSNRHQSSCVHWIISKAFSS